MAPRDGEIDSYIRSKGVIPFSQPMGPEFGLLKVLKLIPGHNKLSELVQTEAGLDNDFFNRIRSEEGKRELAEMHEHLDVTPCEDIVGIYSDSHKTSGNFAACLLDISGAKLKGSTASEEKTRYSVTEATKHTYEGSPMLFPFIKKHLPTFTSSIVAMQTVFEANPTRFSGSSECLVAVITTAMTGIREVRTESKNTSSAEVGAAVPEVAALEGAVDRSSSHKHDEDPRRGVLGASFLFSHLCKPFNGAIKVKDSVLVKTAGDAIFVDFLRRARLKRIVRLVVGYPRTTWGFVTEKESTMADHATFEDHAEGMKADERFAALATGEWRDGEGVVNLKVPKRETELRDDQRLDPACYLQQQFQSSLNFIFTAPFDYLSKMYHDLKQGVPVQVAGMTVMAMSPALMVNMSQFLPICYLGAEDDHSDVPGWVIRDFNDAAFIFPVEGHETSMSCATVYNEEWEVRESIVRLDKNDSDEIQILKERGFHEIEPEELEGGCKDGEIVMARHQLARTDTEKDDGSGVFRVRRGDTTGATAIAPSSSVPALRSLTDDSRKKQKTS